MAFETVHLIFDWQAFLMWAILIFVAFSILNLFFKKT
jgi:hypothetical protein